MNDTAGPVIAVDAMGGDHGPSEIVPGVVAALAILFAKWNDAHILMFGMMLAPCWCLFILGGNREARWRDYRYWGRIVVIR